MLPATFLDTTLSRTRPIPPKPFLFHQSSYFPALRSFANENIVKYPLQKCRSHVLPHMKFHFAHLNFSSISASCDCKSHLHVKELGVWIFKNETSVTKIIFLAECYHSKNSRSLMQLIIKYLGKT